MKFFRNVVSVFFLIFSVFSIKAKIDQAAEAYLDQFFKQYQRSITIFEICGKTDLYSTKIARDRSFDSTSVVILFEEVSRSAQQVMQENLPNVVILRPQHPKMELLDILGKCEHPDVVLVHALPSSIHGKKRNPIATCLILGDYLGIDIKNEEQAFFTEYETSPFLITKIPHENGDGGFFAFFKTDKKGLESARWNNVIHAKKSNVDYRVESDFKEKNLLKKYFHKPTNAYIDVKSVWLQGINLETFVMMEGIYPSDATIHKGVEALKSIEHNDLVLGNLVIQGQRIIAIDFADKRRSARFSKHFKALVKIFKSHKRLGFARPQDFIAYYKRYL